MWLSRARDVAPDKRLDWARSRFVGWLLVAALAAQATLGGRKARAG